MKRRLPSIDRGQELKNNEQLPFCPLHRTVWPQQRSSLPFPCFITLCFGRFVLLPLSPATTSHTILLSSLHLSTQMTNSSISKWVEKSSPTNRQGSGFLFCFRWRNMVQYLSVCVHHVCNESLSAALLSTKTSIEPQDKLLWCDCFFCLCTGRVVVH